MRYLVAAAWFLCACNETRVRGQDDTDVPLDTDDTGEVVDTGDTAPPGDREGCLEGELDAGWTRRQSTYAALPQVWPLDGDSAFFAPGGATLQHSILNISSSGWTGDMPSVASGVLDSRVAFGTRLLNMESESPTMLFWQGPFTASTIKQWPTLLGALESPQRPSLVLDLGTPRAATMDDIDADGAADLVVWQYSGAQTFVLWGPLQQNHNVADAEPILAGFPAYHYYYNHIDWNDDGYLDRLVDGEVHLGPLHHRGIDEPPDIRILTPRTREDGPEHYWFQPDDQGYPVSDLDRDGSPDVWMWDGGRERALAINLPEPGTHDVEDLIAIDLYTGPDASLFDLPRTGDFNGDGFTDVAARTGGNASYLTLWSGPLPGRLVIEGASRVLMEEEIRRNIGLLHAPGDLNHDGRDDLAALGMHGADGEYHTLWLGCSSW